MAGSFARIADRKGTTTGRGDLYSTPVGITFSVVADASNASVPDISISGVAGFITDIEVIFDDTATPDTITAELQTPDGSTLVSAVTGTSTFRIPIYDTTTVNNGFIVKLSDSSNSVNSAEMLVVVDVS